MDSSECKHVVLGLIFLKYISDAFNEQFDKIEANPQSDPKDRNRACAGAGREAVREVGSITVLHFLRHWK